MTFWTNNTISLFTQQWLEKGGHAFLDEVLNHDLGFMSSIHNTMQYWYSTQNILGTIMLVGASQGSLRSDRSACTTAGLHYAVSVRDLLGEAARNGALSASGTGMQDVLSPS
ncbi:hypothetical protein MRX96_019404 [Rhipicephalus microplus]